MKPAEGKPGQESDANAAQPKGPRPPEATGTSETGTSAAGSSVANTATTGTPQPEAGTAQTSQAEEEALAIERLKSLGYLQ